MKSKTMTPETSIEDRTRAREKLRAEIAKGVASMMKLGAETSVMELGYFLTLLHWTRVLQAHPEEGNGLRPVVVKTSMSLMEETVKYVIQICAKTGKPAFLSHKKDIVIRQDLVASMLRLGNELNQKFELHSPFSLMNVKVGGARDQLVEVHIGDSLSDAETKSLHDYFVRISIESVTGRPRLGTELLPSLRAEFALYADLFHSEFGVSVDEYFNLMDFLCDAVKQRMEKMLPQLPEMSPGRIDPQNAEVILAMFSSMCLRREDVVKKFGSQIEPLLNQLTFDPAAFDESELRFNHIARRPLIVSETHFLVSPTLVLDSLLTNTHYTLLEGATTVKEAYKARASDQFLSKLARLAAPFGYEEIGRNLDIYDGSTGIGDLDLVLRHSTGKVLIIEGKNTALPLPVYFGDADAARKQLATTRDWQNKVQRRISWLNAHPGSFGIPCDFEYIIVSREPEVLSHFSPLLVVSVREFEFWLDRGGSLSTFHDLFVDRYENAEHLSADEIKQMVESGFAPDFNAEPKE